MTKTSKVKKDMSFGVLLSALFRYKTFDENYKKTKAAIYAGVCVILISIVSLLKNNIENYSYQSNLTVFFYNTIGLTIFCFGLYTILYIFMNSYENKSKSYLEGFFIGTTIFLPLMFIGNLLDYLAQISLNLVVASVAVFVITVLAIYAVVAYVLHLKNYYKTTFPKVLASLLQTFLVFMMIFISAYLTQLISSLR